MTRWTKGLVAAGLMSVAVPAFAAEATKGTGTQGSQQGTMQGGQQQGSQQQGSQQQGSQQFQQRVTSYTGVVKEVDKDKNMVTLQLPLAPNASVLKDGQRASIDDLKEGDDVRASFDPQSNKIIRLDIQSGKEMKEQCEQGRPLNE